MYYMLHLQPSDPSYIYCMSLQTNSKLSMNVDDITVGKFMSLFSSAKKLHLVHNVPLVDRTRNAFHLLLLTLLGRWCWLVRHLVILHLLVVELNGEGDELTVFPWIQKCAKPSEKKKRKLQWSLPLRQIWIKGTRILGFVDGIGISIFGTSPVDDPNLKNWGQKSWLLLIAEGFGYTIIKESQNWTPPNYKRRATRFIMWGVGV